MFQTVQCSIVVLSNSYENSTYLAIIQRNSEPLHGRNSEIVKFFLMQDILGYSMDDVDKEIIKILKSDGRTGYSEIGKQIGLSEGAVRKRIKTLSDSGVIRRFTVKIGVAEGAEAIALLSVSPSFPTQEVSKRIQTIPNVETTYEVTGEYDIVAVIGGLNVVEVNDCVERIRRVEGITKTNTMIVLRSW
jgi:Lrp/AsnC family transcriptional regulator, regulator for asnA, asnC and gidA